MPSFNRMITAYSYKNILFHHNKNTQYFCLSQTTNNDLRHEIKKENFEYKNDNKIESIKFENVSFSYDEKKS